jgi:hypothetical protein
MSEAKKEIPKPTKDSLEKSLIRLRKRMTYVKDELDITSFAITAIERDLNEMQTEDKEANETNA